MKFAGAASFGFYLDMAAQTEHILISGKQFPLPMLERVHDFYPEVILAGDLKLTPSTAFLSTHAFALWLAASRVALSGHEAAVYPLLRTALEAACYAFLAHKDDRLASIWANREKDDAARAACRREFTSAIKRVATMLSALQSEMGDVVVDCYDRLIDFGAHPNTRSVLSHVTVTEHENAYRADMPALYASSSYQVTRGLVACIDVGVIMALVLIKAFHSENETVVTALNELISAQNEIGSQL